MIEETERLMQQDLSSNIEEVEENNSLQLVEDSANIAQDRRISVFFIQLLICSVLIWSLLFMKDGPYGQQIINELNKILSENIKVAPIEQAIDSLTVAVKQIL